MDAVDLLGYLASALVLATFCMQDMLTLRGLAIASNLAFIGYGALADLHPVLLLHMLLLPINLWRLAQGIAQHRSAAETADRRRQQKSLDSMLN